jgi:hypothetical protein
MEEAEVYRYEGLQARDLYPLKAIAEHISGVTYKQLNRWAGRRKTTGFPEVKKQLGIYQLYSDSEVKEWYELWRRVTANSKPRGTSNGSVTNIN